MDKRIVCFLLLLASALFVLVFSTAGSPLFPISQMTTDPGVYQLIGFNWLKGVVPYRDLFDQKGPLIYFVNAVGYWLTGNRYGVGMIEVVCLWWSLVYCFRLLRTVFDARPSLWGTLLTLVCLAIVFDDGDMVEELVLPLLFMSFYYTLRWWKGYEEQGRARVGWQMPFVFGLVLGVSFLTRLTNALAVCIVALFVLGVLLHAKEYKCLGRCVLAYLLGAALPVLPFVVYFYLQGALADMWFCVITFNVKYAASSLPITWDRNYLLGFSASWVLSLVSAVALVHDRKSRLLSALLLTIGLVTSAYFFKGRGYLHYAIIALPYWPLAFCLYKVTERSYGRRAQRLWAVAYCCVLSPFVVFCVGHGVTNVAKKSNACYSGRIQAAQELDDHDFRELVSGIPKTEYDDMVAVNCKTRLYLYTLNCPACRFFILQDFQTSFDKKLNRELLRDFACRKAKWVIVDRREQPSALTQIIREKYRLVKQTIALSLYCAR